MGASLKKFYMSVKTRIMIAELKNRPAEDLSVLIDSVSGRHISNADALTQYVCELIKGNYTLPTSPECSALCRNRDRGCVGFDFSENGGCPGFDHEN